MNSFSFFGVEKGKTHFCKNGSYVCLKGICGALLLLGVFLPF